MRIPIQYVDGPPSAAQPATDASGATQVSLTDYNARNEAYQTIDPAGNVTLTTCDDEGRTIETIQNYSSTISAATNITTDSAFNANSALLSATSVTTENATCTGTQTQITAYMYGTATDDSSPLIYRDDRRAARRVMQRCQNRQMQPHGWERSWPAICAGLRKG